MENNPGYYQKLVNLIPKFGNCYGFDIIEVDLPRTFKTMEFFKNADNLKSLSNILKAFTFRNSPSISYIQGFNYIAAQIFLVMQNEEKVFWTFTNIIEDYIPFNYHFNMIGVKVYNEILLSLITDKIKVFRDHKELYPDFQSIILGCIPALFAHQIDIEVLRNIWDIFFIYGYVIILRAFIFLLLFCSIKNIKIIYLKMMIFLLVI